jgi:hypothetical protein
MKQTNRLAALFVLALASTAAIAQTPAAPAPAPTPAPPVGSIAGHPGWPVAKPADVSSPEAILNALYSVISGPKGQARDWDRMRSLFVPDARLIPSRAGKDGHADVFFRTVDQYIARNSALMMADGFFEHSIHNEFQQFGNIMQIWSTYESRHNADDPAPFDRGINSIQLLKDGDRYWVINIVWAGESPEHPIPAKYLPN